MRHFYNAESPPLADSGNENSIHQSQTSSSSSSSSYLSDSTVCDLNNTKMNDTTYGGGCNGGHFNFRHNLGAGQSDLLQCISSTCAKSSRLSLVNLLPSRLEYLLIFYFYYY